MRARRRKQKTEGLKFAGGIGKGRYARGSRGRRQIEVGATSTFVLKEEQAARTVQLMSFDFLRIVLYFQSDLV